MRRTLKFILAFGATAATGCSTDVAAPQNEFSGIKYTAEVADVPGPISGTHQFSVIVTLQNNGGDAKTRTYPASCPVRIRLYRVSDGRLLYDETKWTCAADPLVTLTIDGFSSKTLQSGTRFPTNVMGDSLPHTTYTVYAVVLTEGSTLVEIRAGTISL
jgi:hypothetical protein